MNIDIQWSFEASYTIIDGVLNFQLYGVFQNRKEYLLHLCFGIPSIKFYPALFRQILGSFLTLDIPSLSLFQILLEIQYSGGVESGTISKHEKEPNIIDITQHFIVNHNFFALSSLFIKCNPYRRFFTVNIIHFLMFSPFL